MSAFGGLLLTNKGRNLQAKAQAGIPLVYTRIALGDGQLGTSPIFELNSLKNEVMSLPIGKLKVINSTNAVIGTILNNSSITSGYYFREIGVFATDPDIGEILYCYGNAGNAAEYIPPGGGADLIEKAIDVQVLTGNATNISAVIDQSLIFETPTGAQDKADAAKEAAKKHSDENLATHLAEDVLNAHLPKNVGLGNVQNYGIASQEEAEMGILNNKYMTPLRVAELLNAIGSKNATGTYTGTSTTTTRTISVGFTPKLVIVTAQHKQSTSGVDGAIINSAHSGFYLSTAPLQPKLELAIVNNGFKVGGNNREVNNNYIYEWIAFA